MTNSWVGWLAFIVLVSVIGITSCQAGFAAPDTPRLLTER